MTNVSDKDRNTVQFGNFSGQESLRPIKATALAGPVLAAPQTAAYGFVTSLIGGNLGGKVGEKLGNR